MDKFTQLKQELEKTKIEKENTQKHLEYLDTKEREIYSQIAASYQDFFEKKQNKEFILYEKFPSIEALNIYFSFHRSFPLHDEGKLNVIELAEVIKHLYQFKTGKEYHIFTVGATELDFEPIYGGKSNYTRPHLNLLIGNENTLAPYQELNGVYSNDRKTHPQIYFAHGKDLINIEVEGYGDRPLKIECLTNNFADKTERINYYDIVEDEFITFVPSLDKNIFSSNIRGNLNCTHYKTKGIKDALDFDIHPLDSYIAKVLVSMIIYKRNNHLDKFSSKDYHHIFNVLYGEDVDIIEEAKKDIPKQLRYIPDKKKGQ